MDLFCCEPKSSANKKAYSDKVLLTDRVLENILRQEERCAPLSTGFPHVQTEVTQHMRKIVVEWMMEVRNTNENAAESNGEMMKRTKRIGGPFKWGLKVTSTLS